MALRTLYIYKTNKMKNEEQNGFIAKPILAAGTVNFETNHWGKSHPQSAENLAYKTLVITSPLQGENHPKFGRLIQIRKNSGAFGSDTILLREADGTLRAFHNCAIFEIKKEFLPLYEEAMKWYDENGTDKECDTYDILGQNPATGFVVQGLDDTDGKLYSFALTVKTNDLI